MRNNAKEQAETVDIEGIHYSARSVLRPLLRAGWTKLTRTVDQLG